MSNECIVAQIKQASGVSRDTLPAHREINAANVDAAFADLKNHCVFARRLAREDGALHKSVRVAARNKVYAVNLRDELRIAKLARLRLWIIAHVRHANDHRAILTFTK